MNRLWILTPKVVLMSEYKTSMSYDDERRDYYIRQKPHLW